MSHGQEGGNYVSQYVSITIIYTYTSQHCINCMCVTNTEYSCNSTYPHTCRARGRSWTLQGWRMKLPLAPGPELPLVPGPGLPLAPGHDLVPSPEGQKR